MNTRQIAEHLARAAAAFPFLGIQGPEALLEVLACELGSDTALDSWRNYGACQTRAVAPGSILHILSGNTPAAGLQSLIRGLLIGTPSNRCKIPTSGLPEIAAFRALLPDELASRVEIASELPPEWLNTSEVVVVFGSDETLEHFRRIVPVTTRLIGYGHKVSVGLVFESDSPEIAARAALDVAIFDQQGCLSPHNFFVRDDPEGFAERLARELELLANAMPRQAITLSEHARIRAVREDYTFASAAGEKVRVWESAGGTDWTVILAADSEFTPSCLNRVIFVKPFPPDVDGWRIPHLSTAAIWPVLPEYAGIAAGLGATRVCAVGRMQNPAFTWHQDGIPTVGSLVRWVDFEPQ